MQVKISLLPITQITFLRLLGSITLLGLMPLLRVRLFGFRDRSGTNVEDDYTNWWSEGYGSGNEPNSYVPNYDYDVADSITLALLDSSNTSSTDEERGLTGPQAIQSLRATSLNILLLCHLNHPPLN